MKWFYPLESKNGELKYESSVTKRSCVLLLEELMMIARPAIKPQEKEEAMEIALEWKEKLKLGMDNSFEVLVFLLLLGALGLASNFDGDELLKLVASVAPRKQASALFKAFGFVEKDPDLS